MIQGFRIRGADRHQALVQTLERELPHALREFAGVAFSRIAGRAVGRYMQNALGETNRRQPGGPLRILSGRLAKSLTNSEGPAGREGHRTISVSGAKLRAEMGSTVPYAAVHEYGASFSMVSQRRTVNIPARPYLRPAMQDEAPKIDKLARVMLRDLVIELYRRQRLGKPIGSTSGGVS